MCVSNYQIEFNSEPVSGWRRTLPVYKFSLAEQIAIDEEVRSLLSKNVIERSQPETGEIISPIFLRPKKESGKFRVIFNLKGLNEYVTYHRFKMDTLQSAINLMTPGCYMTSIDLRDAKICHNSAKICNKLFERWYLLAEKPKIWRPNFHVCLKISSKFQHNLGFFSGNYDHKTNSKVCWNFVHKTFSHVFCKHDFFKRRNSRMSALA